MVISILLSLLKGIVTLFSIPVFICAVLLLIFFLSYLGHIGYYYYLGWELPKGTRQRVKKLNFFYRLFILFPRQFAYDRFHSSPDDFAYKGFHVFCGEQGSGKTIAAVEFIRRMQNEFPLSKCITNFGLETENAELTKWQQLLTYNNGSHGVIVGIDEVQNWFASGKNTLPEQMLEVVTQNRKNRRIIVSTSQVFTRMAKGLREQCTVMYEPTTYLGCLTRVVRKKPILDSEGNVEKYMRLGSYFFVHDKVLRDAYDTYKVIHALAKDGFKDPVPVVQNSTQVTVKAR